MKHYYHTLKSIDWNDSIDSYSELVKITKEFTDYSEFREFDIGAINLYLDPKLTRYVIDGISYVPIKNFINISTGEHFVILRRQK